MEKLSPELIKSLPAVRANVGAELEPFDIKSYISNPEGDLEDLKFTVLQASGESLPDGMSCSGLGVLSGTPAKGTDGASPYQLVVIVRNSAPIPLITHFDLVIHDAYRTSDEVAETKDEVWKAVLDELPLPSYDEIINRPVTTSDIYYLLGQFLTLIIWNADVLESAQQLAVLDLPGQSDQFYVFDRGTSIVITPKELFSHDRGLLEGIETVKAVMAELYKRGWRVEAAGYDKLLNAAWLEAQRLGEIHQRPMEFLYYEPKDAVKFQYQKHIQPGARQRT